MLELQLIFLVCWISDVIFVLTSQPKYLGLSFLFFKRKIAGKINVTQNFNKNRKNHFKIIKNRIGHKIWIISPQQFNRMRQPITYGIVACIYLDLDGNIKQITGGYRIGLVLMILAATILVVRYSINFNTIFIPIFLGVFCFFSLFGIFLRGLLILLDDVEDAVLK